MARNTSFQFKQFIIHQDKSAMKVCTDACVLGAWAEVHQAKHILDIGTGTGLLALMAAQRNAIAEIDAVELDPDASLQAAENVADSIFKDRIKVIHSSVQHFEGARPYDCIITNPPFFQSDLLSPDGVKNKAHHAVSLSFDALLISIERLLSESGAYHILLPPDEAEKFLKKAVVKNWTLTRKLTLYHKSGKKPFRHLMAFKRNDETENQLISEDLYIYQEDGITYHPEFKDLLKDFYLIF